MRYNILILIILLIPMSLAFEPSTFSLHGELRNSTGHRFTTQVNFNVTIYDDYSLGNLLYQETITNVDTDNLGRFFVIVGTSTPVNLNFSNSYYLNLMIDDENILPRINLSSSLSALKANDSDYLGGKQPNFYLDDTDTGITNASQTVGGENLTCTLSDTTYTCDVDPLYDYFIDTDTKGLENATQVAGGNNLTCSLTDTTYTCDLDDLGQYVAQDGNITLPQWFSLYNDSFDYLVQKGFNYTDGVGLENGTEVSGGANITCVFSSPNVYTCSLDSLLGPFSNIVDTNTGILNGTKVTGGQNLSCSFISPNEYSCGVDNLSSFFHFEDTKGLENASRTLGGSNITCSLSDTTTYTCNLDSLAVPISHAGNDGGVLNGSKTTGGQNISCTFIAPNEYSCGLNNLSSYFHFPDTQVPIELLVNDSDIDGLQNITDHHNATLINETYWNATSGNQSVRFNQYAKDFFLDNDTNLLDMISSRAGTGDGVGLENATQVAGGNNLTCALSDTTYTCDVDSLSQFYYNRSISSVQSISSAYIGNYSEWVVTGSLTTFNTNITMESNLTVNFNLVAKDYFLPNGTNLVTMIGERGGGSDSYNYTVSEIEVIANRTMTEDLQTFHSNVTFKGNITVHNFTCYGPQCNAWQHWNGTHLVTKKT